MIMVVDDELDICRLTKEFLETSDDLQVDTFISVREARGALSNNRYDAIVSDYQMPEEDGISFLRSLRENGDDTPFLLFTGKGREEIVIEALNSGANSYMQKGGHPSSLYLEMRHRILTHVDQHRARSQLIESENNFRICMNQSKEALYLHGYDGRIIEVNDTAVRDTGYTREELLAMNVFDIDPTLRAMGDLENIWRSITSNKFETLKANHRRKDGSLYPIDMKLGKLQLNSREYMLVLAEDISGQTLATRTIEGSNQRTHAVMNAAGIAFWEYDPIQQVFAYHGYEKDLSGNERDDVITLSKNEYLRHFIPVEERDDFMKEIGSVLSSDRKDGMSRYEHGLLGIGDHNSRVQVRMMAMRDAQGQALKVFGIYDGTMVPYGNEERSYEPLPEMILTDIDALLMVDMDGKIVRTGRTWERIFGFGKSDIIGSMFDIVHPDDLVKTKAWLSNSMNADFADELRTRLKDKDGTYHALELRQFIQGDAVCGYLIDAEDPELIGDRMKDLVEASEEFLMGSPGEMDHDLITETVTRMSGAKIGTFNLYNDDGSEFTTVALATAKRRSNAKTQSFDKQDDLIVERGRKYLGFDVIGKTWKHDVERARKIEGRTITKFASLRALSGNALPRPIIYLVEKAFRTGEAAVIKIEKDGRMLGDFTLIMSSGSKLINEDLIEIYSRMVGTMLIRRKIEKQLVEKTVLLQRLLNSIPEIIFVKDSAGRYVECNPHFLSMVGLRMEEVLGRTVHDIFDVSTAKRSVSNDELTMSEGRTISEEVWVTYPDGHRALIDTLRSPLRDPDGSITGILGVCRDTTERRNAEAQIIQVRDNYDLFFNRIDDFLYVLDVQGRIIHVNDTVTKRLGYSKEEIIGRSMLMMHPLDRQEEATRTVQAMLDGTADYCGAPLITKDGKNIPVETRVTKGEWNGSPALFGVSKDMSKIMLSEKKFSSSFHLNPTPMALSEYESGRFIDVNEAFLDLTGYVRNEVIGRTSVDLDLFVSKTTGKDVIEQFGDKSYKLNIEMSMRCKDGEMREGSLSMAMIELDGKNHLISTMLDVTDLKRAEKALHRANINLNLMSSVTRHDINNQLMLLMGYIELMSKAATMNDVEAHKAKMMKVAKRISSMIALTREYEGVGTGLMEWQNIRESIERAGEQVELGEVRIVNDVPPDIEILADPIIKKAFNNLIDNAIRHGERITFVHFFLEVHDHDRALICEDDGCGIQLEDKERVFERGFGKNTGLGLFLVREIMSINDITITEEGEPGKGARFVMTLPPGGIRGPRSEGS